MSIRTFALLGLIVSAAAAPSMGAELPFTLHGNVGYGKMLEDNSPNGSAGFGIGMIYPVGEMPVAVGLDLGYLMLGSQDVAGVAGTTKYNWSAIPVTGQLYYTMPASPNTSLYLDAGGGFYNLRWSADLPGGGSDSNSETKFGLNIGAGSRLGNMESPVSFGFDVKFHIVMTENESTNLLTAFGRIYLR